MVVQQVGGMVWDGCVGVWLDGGAGGHVWVDGWIGEHGSGWLGLAWVESLCCWAGWLVWTGCDGKVVGMACGRVGSMGTVGWLAGCCIG